MPRYALLLSAAAIATALIFGGAAPEGSGVGVDAVRAAVVGPVRPVPEPQPSPVPSPSPSPTPAAPEPEPEVAPEPAPEPEPEPEPSTEVPMARVGGIELTHPADEVLGVGMHQAAGRAYRLRRASSDSFVLPSRGRGTHRESAIDIAVPADEVVRSPVAGRVVEARPYTLYGRLKDAMVVIVPDERPDLAIRLLHLRTLRVDVGDRVAVGDDIAKAAHLLPFASQIDDTVGRVPHVHIDVRRR